MQEKTLQCWVISEDKAGMIAQARGLAGALQNQLQAVGVSLQVSIRLIEGKFPWKFLPNKLWPSGIFGVDLKDGDAFEAPWPDLVISSARKSACVNAEILRRAKAAGKSCFGIHIQNPGIAFSHFDLVTTPYHDRLVGENLKPTLGSLGRVNREMLDIAAEDWRVRFKDLPQPFIAVSLGGDNKVYKYGAEDMRYLGHVLRQFVKETGGSLLVTSSRRTSPENEKVLREEIGELPHHYWDGKGDNPYFGYLGLADHVVVSCDSANMVSEACATGKPVHVFHVKPTRATKFDIFHKKLEEAGMARAFKQGDSVSVEAWSYDPLNETAEMASHVMEMLRKKGILPPED